MSDYLKVVARRALMSDDPSLLQVSFDAVVLDAYRGKGHSIIRTDTVGRVSKERGWSFDFGIAPDERSIHASWRALMTLLPEGEREHWASHAVAGGGMSDMYLRMQLSPNSCHDDGDLRDW
jgi:hypothetical protein